MATLAVLTGPGSGGLPVATAQTSVTITLGLDATIDAAGNVTLVVTAPGCEVTPPESYPDIVVQTLDPVTGEVGEGAVAIGGFTTPGQGAVVIPAGTPARTFRVTAICNLGAIGGAEAFTLTTPVAAVAAPVATAPAFTG